MQRKWTEDEKFDFDEMGEKPIVTVEGQASGQQSVKYVFTQKLGEGAFGKVKLAVRSDTKELVAIKIFKKSILRKQKELVQTPGGSFLYKDALQDVFREVAIMKKLNHPNALRLFEVVDDVQADKFYMILEYAEGGQIIEWDADSAEFYPLITEGFIPEEELRHIFFGCVNGLLYRNSLRFTSGPHSNCLLS